MGSGPHRILAPVTPLLIILVAVAIVVARWPYDARRLPGVGGSSCAIRLTSGSQYGVRSLWRNGRAQARAGVLTFEPAGPLGLRIPKGKPFDIDIVGAGVETGSTGLSQAWIVNPLLKTMQFTTSGGVITVAASTAILADLRASLLP
jgi:hypothetical protein